MGQGTATRLGLSFVLCATLGCGGADQPQTSTTTSGSATATAETSPPVALPPIQLGVNCQTDPLEPLPAGALARFGTARWRLSPTPSLVTVTDAGVVWEAESRRGLREIGQNQAIGLPDDSIRLIGPNARFVVLEQLNDALVIFDVASRKAADPIKLPANANATEPLKIVSARDGSVLAIKRGKTIHLVDVRQNKLLKTTITPNFSFEVADVSTGGDRVLIDDGGWADPQFVVFDGATGKKVHHVDKPSNQPRDTLRLHVLSPDGTTVYFLEQIAKSEATPATVFKVDLASKKATTLAELGAVGYGTMHVSSDGKRLVVAQGPLAGPDDPHVVIDTTSGDVKQIPTKAGRVLVSPNALTVAEVVGQRVSIVGSPDATLRKGSNSGFEDLVFLNGGQQLVTTGASTEVWDARTCEVVAAHGSTTVAAASRDRVLLRTHGYKADLGFLDSAGKLSFVESHLDYRADFALSDDPAIAFAADKQLQIVDVETGKVRGALDLDPDLHPWAVAVSSSYIAVNGLNHLVLAKSSPDWRLGLVKKLETDVAGGQVLFVKDSQLLLNRLSRASIFDVPSLNLKKKIGLFSVSPLAVSENGRFLAAIAPEGVRVHDLETRAIVGIVRSPSDVSRIERVALSPDGRYLATGIDDTTVLLWEVDKLQKPTWHTSVSTLPESGLRDGRKPSRLPQEVAAATRVASDLHYSCALVPSQAGFGQDVWCWGTTAAGVLGIPEERKNAIAIQRRDTPVLVKGPANVVDITLSSSYACVITEPRALWCWGRLGDRGDPISPPRLVMNNVLSVSVSDREGCALDNAGSVSCWREAQSAPGVLPGADKAKSLAVGLYHRCILTTGGVARCMGENEDDQLGDGTGIDRDTFVDVVGVSDVVDIAAGDRGTCVLDKRGAVHCWGVFGHNAIRVASPSRIDDLDGATAIGLANVDPCVLKGGTVSCAEFDVDGD